MEIVNEITISSLSFLKHMYGIVTHPYKTYRSIIDHGRFSELLYVAVCCAAYFALSSLVKTSSFRPFLLTKQFVSLVLGAGLGFFLTVFIIAVLGIVFKKKSSLTQIALAWGYTLIPTVCWFLMTSVLYILLPPPRTQAPMGILFSFVYLTLSAVLLFWKAELYFLTLRFGLQLDLQHIAVSTAILVPIFALYSLFMYEIGIFRVPFL